MNEKETQVVSTLRIRYVVVILCLAGAGTYARTVKDLRSKLAVSAGNPVEYVNKRLMPENFERDFDYGIREYDYSLLMQAHYVVQKYLGVKSASFMYIYVFGQLAFFIASTAFLAQTLFKNPGVTLLATLAVLYSPMAGLNLSRFGYGYGSLNPFLFYNYANSFRFLGLTLLLRRRYYPSAVALAAGMYCHVTMALFMATFMGAYLLARPRLLRCRRVLKALALFVLTALPYVLYLSICAKASTGEMDTGDWIKSTRVFCSHWYPLTMRMFTRFADLEFIPVIIVTLAYFMSLRWVRYRRRQEVIVISGSIACMGLVIPGIVFSEVVPIPLVIKLSLPRGTGILTFLYTMYLVHYLYRHIVGRRLVPVVLSVYTMGILYWSKPGIAVMPILGLLYFDLRDGHFGSLKAGRKVWWLYCLVSSLAISAGVLAALAASVKSDKLKAFLESCQSVLWAPLRSLNPLASYDLLLRGGSVKGIDYSVFLFLVAGVSIAVLLLSRFRSHHWRRISVSLLSLGILCNHSFRECLQDREWEKRRASAGDFLAVQLWARESTPRDSLFLVEPAKPTGWRAFSERSSLGCLNEWGFYCITYDPRKEPFEIGLERMRAFGVDIQSLPDDVSSLLAESVYMVYASKLLRDIRRHLHYLSMGDLLSVARQFEVDYIVWPKRFGEKDDEPPPVVFDNESFVVYRVVR